MKDYVVFSQYSELKKIMMSSCNINVEIHIVSEDMPLSVRSTITRDHFMINRKGKSLRLFTHAFNVVENGDCVIVSCCWFNKYTYHMLRSVALPQWEHFVDLLGDAVTCFRENPSVLFDIFDVKDYVAIPPQVTTSNAQFSVQF